MADHVNSFFKVGLYLPLFLLYVLHLQAETPDQRLESYARSPQWTSLLHMKSRWMGSYISRIEKGSPYFVSERGYEDADSELRQSLYMFRHPKEYETLGRGHPSCLFPARLKVLSRSFSLPIDKVSCPEYEKWKKMMQADRVAIVFASQYASSPGSMMGHTLFKFIKNGREDYLNTDIGYAADIDDNVGAFSYVYNGLMGGFKGVWPEGHYYEKVHEYTNMERRDIWEYDLVLNPQEIDLLLDHIWELQKNAQIDYFFADENCSFMTLAVLQVVKPEKDMLSGFPIYVIPFETVKKMDRENLLSGERFRPSIRRKMLFKYENLNSDEQSQLRESIRSGNLPPQNTVESLEALLDYLTLKRQIENGVLDEKNSALEKQALSARARLGQRITRDPPTPPSPLRGQGTYAAWFGAGTDQTQRYGKIGIRPAVHGYLDRDQGYLNNSTFSFIDTEIKYLEADGFRVSRISVLDFGSATPYSRLSSAFSWRLITGYFENKSDFKNHTYDFWPQMGLSWSLSTNFDLQILGSVDWQPFVEHESGHQILGGMIVEGVLRLSNKFKWVQNESYHHELLGSKSLARISSESHLRFYEVLPYFQLGLDAEYHSFFGKRENTWQTSIVGIFDF